MEFIDICIGIAILLLAAAFSVSIIFSAIKKWQTRTEYEE